MSVSESCIRCLFARYDLLRESAPLEGCFDIATKGVSVGTAEPLANRSKRL